MVQLCMVFGAFVLKNFRDGAKIGVTSCCRSAFNI